MVVNWISVYADGPRGMNFISSTQTTLAFGIRLQVLCWPIGCSFMGESPQSNRRCASRNIELASTRYIVSIPEAMGLKFAMVYRSLVSPFGSILTSIFQNILSRHHPSMCLFQDQVPIFATQSSSSLVASILPRTRFPQVPRRSEISLGR